MTRIRRITPKQFKTILDQKADTDNLMIAKGGHSAEVRQVGGPDDRILEFVISTGAVDRDGDTLAIDGWELDNFRKTGTVLWAHNGDMPPIADPLSVDVVDAKLVSAARFMGPDFADHDHAKFADLIYKMYGGGFMKATSVGFLPMSWAESNERGGWWPTDYLKQELLEWSTVPVPANPEALYQAGQRGLDLSPLRKWAGQALEKGTTSGLWIPKGDLEELLAKLEPVIEIVDTEAAKTADDAEPDSSDEQGSSTEPDEDQAGAGEPVKGAISYASAHPDGTPLAAEDEAWDGPAEVAAADIEDLKIMATWVDPEQADVKAGYKLEHHKAEGEHAVVWNGVAAAMGALLGARGGVDIPADDLQPVYDHLAQHYRQFEKEPPALEGEEDEEPAADEDADELLDQASASDDGKDFDEDPDTHVYMMYRWAFSVVDHQKAGRVLSSANERLLREAHEQIGQVLAKLDKEDPVDDDGADADDKAVVFELLDEQPADDNNVELDFDKEEMSTMIKEAVDQAMINVTGQLPS